MTEVAQGERKAGPLRVFGIVVSLVNVKQFS